MTIAAIGLQPETLGADGIIKIEHDTQAAITRAGAHALDDALAQRI